jgi:hypothetical protein
MPAISHNATLGAWAAYQRRTKAGHAHLNHALHFGPFGLQRKDQMP